MWLCILVTPALKIPEPWDCAFMASQMRFSLTQNKQTDLKMMTYVLYMLTKIQNNQLFYPVFLFCFVCFLIASLGTGDMTLWYRAIVGYQVQLQYPYSCSKALITCPMDWTPSSGMYRHTYRQNIHMHKISK